MHTLQKAQELIHFLRSHQNQPLTLSAAECDVLADCLRQAVLYRDCCFEIFETDLSEDDSLLLHTQPKIGVA